MLMGRCRGRSQGLGVFSSHQPAVPSPFIDESSAFSPRSSMTGSYVPGPGTASSRSIAYRVKGAGRSDAGGSERLAGSKAPARFGAEAEGSRLFVMRAPQVADL